jgi:hypothetical protein
MFTILKKLTRSDVKIPFFFEINPKKDIVGEHILKYYVETKKIIVSKKEFSNENLQVNLTISFNSYDDYKEFISDKFLENNLFAPNMSYDIKYEITNDSKYEWEK